MNDKSTIEILVDYQFSSSSTKYTAHSSVLEEFVPPTSTQLTFPTNWCFLVCVIKFFWRLPFTLRIRDRYTGYREKLLTIMFDVSVLTFDDVFASKKTRPWVLSPHN